MTAWRPAGVVCRNLGVRAMGLDNALRIVNDPSLTAYADYTHQRLYRAIGEFEFGYDDSYDEIVTAHAFVALEMALDDELLAYVPDEPSAAEEPEA